MTFACGLSIYTIACVAGAVHEHVDNYFRDRDDEHRNNSD